MKDGIAMDEGPAPRKDLLRDMQNNGVRFCTETSVQEVTDHSVIVSGKVNEELSQDWLVQQSERDIWLDTICNLTSY